MCGVVATVSKGGVVDFQTLEKMSAAIAHRGPDGDGIFISNDRGLGMAHRRLAILDLDVSANQPFFLGTDEDLASSFIIFNGEIFNHLELRKELEQLGRKFKTSHSDTEVILQGFDEWGIAQLLSKLNGMFAFIIFCKSSNSIYVAERSIWDKTALRLGKQR